MSQFNRTVTKHVDVTTPPGAYGSADNVGGLLTLDFSSEREGGTGATIRRVSIKDESARNAIFKVHLFNRPPSASTITDNAAIDIDWADIEGYIATVNVAAADYVTLTGGHSVAAKNDLAIDFQFLYDSDLYVVLELAGSTPDYTAGLKVGVTLWLD